MDINVQLLEALKQLVYASTPAYKQGRIPAEPFVAARNLIDTLERA
jgi:hypothetical protein